jgi:hypothetical protein
LLPSASQRSARLGAGLQTGALLLPALLLLLAALCWLCFFHGIEVLYALDKTEALQLEIARQMAVGGAWITPAVDGLLYFDKPPLPYWVGGLLLRSFPGQVWLPRLGAAFFACIGVGATLVLSRYGSRDRLQRRALIRAVSAAAILALMPAYQAFARIALHDSYLIASTTVALAGFFLLSQAPDASPQRQRLSGWLVGLAHGLGLLAKGLLSLAATKLPHYILAALPPTAIAAAGFFWPPRAQPDAPGRLPQVLLVASAALLLLLALLLVWMPPWLIPISTSAPAFTLGLQERLASPPVLLALLALSAAGCWAAWHGSRPHLLLGAFWAVGIITVLLLLAPPRLQLYRHDHQGARLALADRALREAQAGEPIQVVGKSWYSVRIRTQGRAEILRHGRALNGPSGPSGGDAACNGPKLLLGPARKVEQVGRTCAPMALVILQRDAGAELLLARLQPAEARAAVSGPEAPP